MQQTVEELGHGGFGRVFRWRDQQSQSVVAVKLFRNQLERDEEQIRMENLTALTPPPNLFVEMFGPTQFPVPQTNGQHFYAIKYHYYPLGSVEKFIDDLHPVLTEQVLLSWLGDIAHGLDFLHGHGLIHCDIKPANVLVNEGTNSLVIGDLGALIKRSIGAKLRHVVGTVAYASPEMLRKHGITTQADIFCMGNCLLEWVTGRLPQDPTWEHWFLDEDSHIQAVLNRLTAPTWPPQIAGYSFEFSQILQGMLRVDPMMRLTALQVMGAPAVSGTRANPAAIQLGRTGKEALQDLAELAALQEQLTVAQDDLAQSRATLAEEHAILLNAENAARHQRQARELREAELQAASA